MPGICFRIPETTISNSKTVPVRRPFGIKHHRDFFQISAELSAGHEITRRSEGQESSEDLLTICSICLCISTCTGVDMAMGHQRACELSFLWKQETCSHVGRWWFFEGPEGWKMFKANAMYRSRDDLASAGPVPFYKTRHIKAFA